MYQAIIEEGVENGVTHVSSRGDINALVSAMLRTSIASDTDENRGEPGLKRIGNGNGAFTLIGAKHDGAV
ncbi:hypothetical protein OS31_15350 [Dickeya oryzae]